MRVSPFYIIVQIDSKENHKIRTESGIEFYRGDLEHNKDEIVRTYGKVVAVPEENKSERPHMIPRPTKGNVYITDHFSMRNGKRVVSGRSEDTDLFRISHIKQQIQPGDIAHFRYTGITESSLFTHEGELYQGISPLDIFMVVRDGKEIMIGGNCIIELEEQSDKIAESSLLVIPESFKKPVKKDRGILRNIGDPLKGEETLPVSIGTKVYFNPEMLEWVDVDGLGRKVHIINQTDIIMYD